MVWPRLYKMPGLIQQAFPDLTWVKETDKKALFLTFDDAPNAELTPWILDLLNTYQAAATFFCVGDKAASNRYLIDQIQKAGHQVGNHTYHHVNGWSHDAPHYLADVEACKEVVPSSLFRPPYGKIKPSQVRLLNEKRYEIVMWDVLTYDFDPTLDPEKALHTCTRQVQAGSIVVFHDSQKALTNIKWLLPRFLAYFTNQGYQFQTL